MTRRALRADAPRRRARTTAAPPDAVNLRIVARRFAAEEAGATMIEYGMAIALIAIMVMSAVYMLGGGVAIRVAQVAACLGTRVCP
jgi:Flp pilus assembly pilin Flp